MYLNFLGTLQTLMGLKKSHLHCHMHEIVVFLNGDGDSFSFLCLLGFSKVHFGALPYKTSNKEGKEKKKQGILIVKNTTLQLKICSESCALFSLSKEELEQHFTT